MDNQNNNVIGDNQNTNMGQGIYNDQNNTGTPVQSTDYNSVQPQTSQTMNVDDFTSTTAPSSQPTEPTPPVPLEETVMPTDAPVATPFEAPQAEPTVTETTPLADATPTMEQAMPVTDESIGVAPPSFDIGSTPLEEQPTQEAVSETPAFGTTVQETTTESPAFDTTAQETVTETPAFGTIPQETETETPAFGNAPTNLSEPLPSVAPVEDVVLPTTENTEVISTLGEETSEGKSGKIVVMVLIFIIVALLLTIGYFAYQIFFA